MSNLVFLIEQIAIGLYILCGLGVLLGLRAYLLGRQQFSASQFELQKELARYRTVNATTFIWVSVEVALAVFAISNVVAPTLRAQPPQTLNTAFSVVETPFRTAVPGSLLNGTPPPSFEEGVEIPGLEDQLNLQVVATPTLTPTPVGTIIPDVPAATGCDTPGARLTIPANGMVVFEATKIEGSATTEDFSYYRFELNGPETRNVWATLSEYTIPVLAGELGQIVPSQLTPGEYRFRLSVFDITNQPKESCTITIFISEPIPTPTPIRES